MRLTLFEQFNVEKQRIPAIDFLKLLASILVIFSHCMLKYIDNGDANPLFNLIWITQMPLFMFASGMVFPKSDKLGSLKKYIYRLLKDVLTLLFPCFTFMCLISISTGSSLSSLIVRFYLNPESNLWFLWVLFLIHLIFNFGIFISNKIEAKFSIFIPDIISICVTLIIALLMLLLRTKFDFSILSIKLLGYYLPFYVLGHLFSMLLKSKLSISKKAQTTFLIVFAFSLIVVVASCFAFKSIYRFSDNSIFYLLIRVGLSVCAVYTFVTIADLITRKPIFIKLSKYGAFSLQSYYMHLLAIRFLNYSTLLVEHQWFLAFSTGFILISLVIVVIVVLYYIPYLHLIIFGKSHSKYGFEKKLPAILR